MQPLGTQMKTRVFNLSGGYAALASVLVVTALVLVIGLSSSLLSINDAQTSLAAKKNEESVGLVEACVEEALLQLRDIENIPNNIVLPEGTCNVVINSQTGIEWDFTVSHTLEGYTKRVRVLATRSSSIILNVWIEVE